jgi:hypothetical protein
MSIARASSMALSALVLIALAYACGIYDVSLLIPALPDGGDGGIEVDTGAGCPHRVPPSRPTADDPSPTPNITFYNAAKYLDFGLTDVNGALPVIGFDLDKTCTCMPDIMNAPGPESCKTPMGTPPHCDQTGGVDNEGQALLRQFKSTMFFDQDYINARLAGGFYGTVLRVDDYNGQANDTQVKLSVFTSNGTEGIQIGVPATPNYDGNDLWTLDSNGLLGGMIGPDGPIAKDSVDTNAYVRDYQLVGALNFVLSLGSGTGDFTVPIELTGGVVVAKLTPDMGSFRIDDGEVSGRWSARKMLTALQVLNDPFDMTNHLCGTDSTYLLLKPKICSFIDLTQNLLDDGKNAPCDALSLGMKFKSSPAKIGKAFPRAASPTPCGPQWQDSCQ